MSMLGGLTPAIKTQTTETAQSAVQATVGSTNLAYQILAKALAQKAETEQNSSTNLAGHAGAALQAGGTVKQHVNALTDAANTVASCVISFFDTISDAASNTFQTSSDISTFLSILSAPATVITLAKTMVNDIYKGDAEDRLNGALVIGAGVTDLLNQSSSVINGLQRLGTLANSAAAWTQPLGIATAALSVFAIIINARELHETNQYLKETGLGGYTQRDFAKGSTDLVKADTALVGKELSILHKLSGSGKAKLESHFGVDGKKLGAKLESMKGQAMFINGVARNALKNNKELPKGVTESANKLSKEMGVLKERVKYKAFSQKLNILIGVIGLIASIIMLCCPPLLMAALTVAAILTLITIAKKVVDHIKTKNFEIAMGIREPKKTKEKTDGTETAPANFHAMALALQELYNSKKKTDNQLVEAARTRASISQHS